MKHLETATQALQKCLENVLHENELRYRATSMTDAHYESLRQPFVETTGSAMLQWLQLSVDSANPVGQGGNELNDRKLKINLISFSPFFVVVRTEVVAEPGPISSPESNLQEMAEPLYL